MAGYKMNDAIRDSILMGIHQYNFKNGAFKNTITKSTTIVDALNIFLSSSLLSQSDRDNIKSFRKTYIQVRKRWSDEKPNKLDAFAINQTMEPLLDMFRNDARDRGLYTPPACIQVMNDDGTVDRTINLETGAETKGGIPGVPAGAPKEFVELNKLKTRDMVEGAKNTDTKMLIANQFRPETVGSGFEEKEAGVSASANEGKEKKPEVKEDKSDFGNGFARNLRGAFM